MKINQPLMTVMKSYPFKRRKKDAGVLNVRLILESTFKDVIIVIWILVWNVVFVCRLNFVGNVRKMMMRSIALISKCQLSLLFGDPLFDDGFIVLFAHWKKNGSAKISYFEIEFDWIFFVYVLMYSLFTDSNSEFQLFWGQTEKNIYQ